MEDTRKLMPFLHNFSLWTLRTYFVDRLGEDAHGKLIAGALGYGSDGCGVHLDYVRSAMDEPTGHAVVMRQSDGQDSIIIIGGATMRGWRENMSDDDLEVVRNAGIVLLQREIPDSINIQVAKDRSISDVFISVL